MHKTSRCLFTAGGFASPVEYQLKKQQRCHAGDPQHHAGESREHIQPQGHAGEAPATLTAASAQMPCALLPTRPRTGFPERNRAMMTASVMTAPTIPAVMVKPRLNFSPLPSFPLRRFRGAEDRIRRVRLSHPREAFPAGRSVPAAVPAAADTDTAHAGLPARRCRRR